MHCGTVTTVDFGSATSLETIGHHAFRSMALLASVDMSGATQLTSIGGIVFESCPKLASLKLAKSTTSVGNYAFTSTKLTTAATVDFNGVNCATVTGGGLTRFMFACPSSNQMYMYTGSTTDTWDNNGDTQCCGTGIEPDVYVPS